MVNDDENYVLRILFGKSMFLEHMGTEGIKSPRNWIAMDLCLLEWTLPTGSCLQLFLMGETA